MGGCESVSETSREVRELDTVLQTQGGSKECHPLSLTQPDQPGDSAQAQIQKACSPCHLRGQPGERLPSPAAPAGTALPGTIPLSLGWLCVHTESLAAPPAGQGAGGSPVTPKLNQLTLDRALVAQ